jgi:hypothetical protein
MQLSTHKTNPTKEVAINLQLTAKRKENLKRCYTIVNHRKRTFQGEGLQPYSTEAHMSIKTANEFTGITKKHPPQHSKGEVNQPLCLIKHQDIKMHGEWRYSSTIS